MWICTNVTRKTKAYAGIWWERTLWLRCDECSKEFSRGWMGPDIRARPDHYCSQGCSSSANNKRRWASSENRAKQSETLRTAHKDPEKHARILAGLRKSKGWQPPVSCACKRCGAAFMREACYTTSPADYYCSRSCAVTATGAATWNADQRAAAAVRMSVSSAARWAIPEFRSKMTEAVTQSHQDPVVKERRSASIRKAMSTPEYKKKRSEISKALVPQVFDTKRRNGQFRTSKPENDFVQFLTNLLGSHNVIHQPGRVGRFDMDAKILNPAIWIQFDGIYYHGLDRPYDELVSHQKTKFDRDREADKWCAENGITLVRVTDREWLGLETYEARRVFVVERLDLPDHILQEAERVKNVA